MYKQYMGTKRDNRNLQEGSYGHIFNRGNRYEDFALEPEDYAVYLNLLERYALKYKQSILAYCLMPNHFHLLLMIQNRIDTIKFITYFSASAAKYYNKKYNTVGHIFQDKYKHRELVNEWDIINVSRYIHRNPLGLDSINDANLIKYPYSSLGEYCLGDKGIGVNTEIVLKNFSNTDSYLNYVVQPVLDLSL